MSKDVIIAVLVSFAVSAILCPVVIPMLHRLKFGQQVRTDGPKEHLKKQGTPTMGGLIFLCAIILAALLFVGDYPQMIPVLFMTVGFGIVGFLDDYIKIVMKRSEGLNPKQKMIGQFVITAIFCYYCMTTPEIGTEIIIPFTGGKTLDISWFYIPFCFVTVLGTDNGVNFTDGLDGLCSSVTVMVATFFAVVALGTNHQVAPLCAAVVGSLMGFLLFNVHPARVFMGDTGSLALGGFVAATACVMRMPLFILLVGLVYLVEVISVMIQVTYFRKTGGKRFFKMAPIHHHFELCGWSETRVVAVFSIVTVLLCLVAYLAL
ncbi:MAG: phospho-N-acetylmuramoyl-pentapeptide-transferase [Lachnospiraceae bacterium]|nr:phospho-N-acetylmuramoyl-pentapeptide-transferase [Lachnospiraceae bacterium]